MAQIFQASTATALQNLIVEHQKAYAAETQRKGGRGTYPDIDTVSQCCYVNLLAVAQYVIVFKF